MSVSQNHSNSIDALASINILHSFKSSHFILICLVVLLTCSAIFGLHKQLTVRTLEYASLQQQSTATFMQDTLAVQTISQDIAQLIIDIKQAMLSFDRQQAMFLDTHQFFLVNSVYQEAAYFQSLIVNTFKQMASLDAAIKLTRDHVDEYQALSITRTEYVANIQHLQNQADLLGRSFFKLSWKFDELTTAFSKTLQIAYSRGFDQAINHFASVGGQKVEAMDASIALLQHQLMGVNTVVDEALVNASQAANVNPVDNMNSISISILGVGLASVFVIWFYGVAKPRRQLSQSIQKLQQAGTLQTVNASQGEWQGITQALEQLTIERQRLLAQYSKKTQELELLKLSMLSNHYHLPETSEKISLNENSLLVGVISKQSFLPGFEQQSHLN